MARGNASALRAFNDFAKPYRAGIKFGTPAYWAATKEAGREYRAGRQAGHAANPSGGKLKSVLLIGLVVAGGAWAYSRVQQEQQRQRAVQAERAKENATTRLLSSNTQEARSYEASAIQSVASSTSGANVAAMTTGRPGF